MGKLTIEEARAVTERFYSQFCGVDLTCAADGVHLICSQARNEEVKGFGCRYSIYALVRENVCVISCAPEYAGFFEDLKGCGAEEILERMNRAFHMKKVRLMIPAREWQQDFGNARILTKADYPLYEAFFRRAYPKADPTGWLREYFEEKAEKGFFAGYMEGDALACVCDAPDMPHMEGEIQHKGIMTLPQARRKGYAKRTAALAARNLMEKGVCPQWECQAENIASVALAESIGYEKYAEAYILEE